MHAVETTKNLINYSGTYIITDNQHLIMLQKCRINDMISFRITPIIILILGVISIWLFNLFHFYQIYGIHTFNWLYFVSLILL